MYSARSLFRLIVRWIQLAHPIPSLPSSSGLHPLFLKREETLVEGGLKNYSSHFQLKEIRQASLGATPEALLHKIEEETKVNTYIVTQKLPKEIEQRRQTVLSLERIINQPALGRDDLNQLREQARVCLRTAF